MHIQSKMAVSYCSPFQFSDITGIKSLGQIKLNTGGKTSKN